MCGIVGYAGKGKRRAAEVIYGGLQKLEYRGYDSVGIAVFNGGKIDVCKRKGRVSAIENEARSMGGTVGIGHTRWATHGEPSDRNAHPHTAGKITLVHNGIIENFPEITREAKSLGIRFASDTDSEAAAWLIDREYAALSVADGDFDGDAVASTDKNAGESADKNALAEGKKRLLLAMKNAVEKMKGSFAFCVLCADVSCGIAVAKRGSPLILGEGDGENFAASDIPALAGEAEKFHVLKDGAFAFFTADEVEIYGEDLRLEKTEETRIELRAEAPDKGQFPHFMLKEIFEEAQTLTRTAESYLCSAERAKLKETFRGINRIVFAACGTAYHSALAARYAIEALARVPVSVERAGEFRSQNPVIDERTLVIAVTQSGETADTVAALKTAKSGGAKTLAVTNSAYSTVTTVAATKVVTKAGAEIGVAATKSYIAQLGALFLIALDLAEAKYPERAEKFELYRRFVQAMPPALEKISKRADECKPLAKRLVCASSVYFLGKLSDYATATEGSLKLKEIAYVLGESYPSGELKHGTLALVDESTFSVAVVSSRRTAEKTFNALHEVKSRGGKTLVITPFPFEGAADETFLLVEAKELCESFCKIGVAEEELALFMPVLCVVPLQLIAYFAALEKGNDPDKPRNLAKSVTVE